MLINKNTILNMIPGIIEFLIKFFSKTETVIPVVEDKPIEPIKEIKEVAKEEVDQVKLQPFPVINVIKKLPVSKTAKPYKVRELNKIEQIVIHHSLTSAGSPAAFARYHIDARGWPGIGYHIVIDKEGQIFLTNYFKTVSFHVDNANTKSLGICLVGNYDEETPPQDQIDALRFMLQEIKKTLPQRLQLKRHHDFSHKSCPGTNMEPIFKDLKEEFDKLYTG